MHTCFRLRLCPVACAHANFHIGDVLHMFVFLQQISRVRLTAIQRRNLQAYGVIPSNDEEALKRH